MATSNVTIQVRRDTASAFTSANTTLATGEIGFETNTGKFKIGNGPAWSALPYAVPDLTTANSTFSGTNTFSGSVTVSGPLTATGGITANSTIACNGNLVTAPKLQAYTETANTPAISGNNLTLNLANGNVFGPISLTANISNLTISGTPANGTAGSFTLLLRGNGTAFSVTWPSAVKWAANSTPTLTTTANKTDVFSFLTTDGGTNWFAFKAGQNF
jgi:hypothetical protein